MRAYDRRSGREVYGPRHAFQEPSDLVVWNGVLMAWVGARGPMPYVGVRVFYNGEWHEKGVVQLAPESVACRLVRASFVRLTRDVGTIRLDTFGGNITSVFLTLRRGERMLRVQCGDGATVATKYVLWRGVPPYITLTSIASDPAGVFGTRARPGDVPLAASRDARRLVGCDPLASRLRCPATPRTDRRRPRRLGRRRLGRRALGR